MSSIVDLLKLHFRWSLVRPNDGRFELIPREEISSPDRSHRWMTIMVEQMSGIELFGKIFPKYLARRKPS
jgi:hypothetical protein